MSSPTKSTSKTIDRGSTIHSNIYGDTKDMPTKMTKVALKDRTHSKSVIQTRKIVLGNHVNIGIFKGRLYHRVNLFDKNFKGLLYHRIRQSNFQGTIASQDQTVCQNIKGLLYHRIRLSKISRGSCIHDQTVKIQRRLLYHRIRLFDKIFHGSPVSQDQTVY